MKLRFVWQVLFGALLVWSLSFSPAMSGSLRISMNDGTSVEVPYYWEGGGEVRFEIPGGVAGIPRDQVKSVQEIVTSKPFDPGVLVEAPKVSGTPDQQEILGNLVASRASAEAVGQVLDPDQALVILTNRAEAAGGSRGAVERVYAPMSNLEGDFAELVRHDSQELALVMLNIVSSRRDLKNERFTLTLYDVNGNVVQQRPCELRELDVDKKTLKELNLQGGRLYSVVAHVKPDPKIKRYEITSARR